MIPEVKLQVVMGGIKEVQSSIKTLKKSLDDLEKSFVVSQKSANKKIEADLKSSMRKRSNMMKTYERSYIASLKSMQRAEKNILSSQGLGRSTSSLGMGTRQRSSRIGVGFGGARGSSGGLGGIGGAAMGMGKAIPAIAAAGAALYVFGKAVSLVTGVMKNAASELVSGITQIGGGFSISEAMVAGASTERLAAQISANAAKNAPISKGAVTAWAGQMGGSSEFREKEWATALKAFQQMTGEVSGFKNNAEFFSKMASVTGSDLTMLAKSAGILKAQFKNLSDVDIQDLMLQMWESGKMGTIEITDMDKLAEITGRAGGFKGDLKENIMNLVSGVQIVAPDVGGSASEAVTRIKSTITSLLGNSAYMAGAVGRGSLEKDESGKFKFKSVSKAFADMAYMSLENMEGLRKALPNVRSQEAAVALGKRAETEGIVREKGESKIDYIRRLESFFEGLAKVEGKMEELDSAMGGVKGTVEYQLKAAFSELTGQIGSDITSMLKDNSVEIKEVFKNLSDKIPILTGYFQVLMDLLPVISSSFEILAPAAIGMGLAFLAAQSVMMPWRAKENAASAATLMALLPEMEKRRADREAKERKKKSDEKKARVAEVKGKAAPYKAEDAPGKTGISLPGLGEPEIPDTIGGLSVPLASFQPPSKPVTFKTEEIKGGDKFERAADKMDVVAGKMDAVADKMDGKVDKGNEKGGKGRDGSPPR